MRWNTKRWGFTFTEVMIALAVTSMVTAGALGVYISSQKTWQRTTLEIEASHEASLILEKMVYGVEQNYGLRCGNSDSVSILGPGNAWTLYYLTPDGLTNMFSYNGATKQITYQNSGGALQPIVVGEGVSSASAAPTNAGVQVAVTVGRRSGMYAATNTMSTYVNMRN